jgi:acyl carrier protein phosphodiesterase
MNFLAHSLLSPRDPLVMLGNLCGDLVKGTKFEGINSDIVKGVRLHRAIDSFTDSHQLIREAKAIVRPEFKLFSGVVIDMFLDHYIAKNHSSLKTHIDYVYKSANAHSTLLPSSFNNMLQFMEKYNWLQTYASLEGLKNIMLQMRKRIGNKSPLDEAVNIMVCKEEEFNYLFKQIWQDAQTKYFFE